MDTNPDGWTITQPRGPFLYLSEGCIAQSAAERASPDSPPCTDNILSKFGVQTPLTWRTRSIRSIRWDVWCLSSSSSELLHIAALIKNASVIWRQVKNGMAAKDISLADSPFLTVLRNFSRWCYGRAGGIDLVTSWAGCWTWARPSPPSGNSSFSVC